MDVRELTIEHGTVTTESSIWTIDQGRYQRQPRNRQARTAPVAVDGALDDNTWIAFTEAWIEPHPGAPGRWRAAFIPAGRVHGSAGVRTGVIVDATFAAPGGAGWTGN